MAFHGTPVLKHKNLFKTDVMWYWLKQVKNL